MTEKEHRKWISTLPLFFTAILFFLYLLQTSPLLYEDSPSYISFHPVRPPLYPIFIWLFHGFQQYQFMAVMWAQSALIFASLVYAKSWLEKKLKLSSMMALLSVSLMLLCLFYYKTFRLIGSEGLAFPLFIFAYLTLIDCFTSHHLKKILLLSFLTLLLVLTRVQFYFFYGLFAVLIFYYFIKKCPLKFIFSAIVLLTSSVVFTFLAMSGYHYKLNKTFSSPPVMGKQLVVQALFLSDKSAERFFTNPTEKALFLEIMTQLEKNRLTQPSENAVISLPAQTLQGYYYAVYNPTRAILDTILKNQSEYEKDRLLTHMSQVLYQNMVKENAVFYFLKVSSFFGSAPLLLAFLMMCFFSGVALIKHHSNNVSSLFIFISLITILINTAFVMIPEAGQACYFFYSYFILFCLAGLLSQTLLKSKGQIA